MKKIKHNKFPIVTVAAISDDFIIGDGNKLLWHLPNDLKRLKNITLGNPIIMGRKTYDSIGKPLPGRANIILTNKNSNKDDLKTDKFFVKDFEKAILKANKWIDKNFDKVQKQSKQIFIFGGGEIYKLALDYCIKIELTVVNVKCSNGVYFPTINQQDWKKKLIQKVEGNEKYPSHSFWTYLRNK